MKITLLQSAIKDLQNLTQQDQRFIRNKIFDLSLHKNIFLHPKVKKLKIMDYRYRAGRFRVFFSAKKETIVIQRIKIRNEKTYK